ncbi:MAG: hypothetical protein A3H98_13055 [Bacteroidetes bacterium RIFCSPLOWO2_02_FULL_36_8]|nr:MAG: hypothetical protein A3H98_13055 [Bacteroidetes bacterium RIFCSPLOWO2_02_FULL_36_8]OFY68916.1 MAG: hypothetical protein A3G23_02860 [Bacteroidetes bacterium RIFCSPLOWO2_12_FULL_37_12]
MRNHPVYRKVRWLFQNINLSKKRQLTLYNFIKLLKTEAEKESIRRKASAVAFSFTLAIFPAMIFIFTLIPYIPVKDLSVQILDFFSEIMPKALFELTAGTIHDIVAQPHGGLLSLGFLMALYTSSNGIMALMEVFSKQNESFKKRNFLKKRGIAVLHTFTLSLLVFIAIILLTVGSRVLDFLHEFGILKDKILYYLLLIFNEAMVVALFFVVISSLYYFLPPVRQKWKFFNPGGMLATFLSLAASYGFSYYLSNFAEFNKLYGSIGAIIALMLWMYVVSYVVLIGFEVNACYYRAPANKLSE